jgi:hypothetical protein
VAAVAAATEGESESDENVAIFKALWGWWDSEFKEFLTNTPEEKSEDSNDNALTSWREYAERIADESKREMVQVEPSGGAQPASEKRVKTALNEKDGGFFYEKLTDWIGTQKSGNWYADFEGKLSEYHFKKKYKRVSKMQEEDSVSDEIGHFLQCDADYQPSKDLGKVMMKRSKVESAVDNPDGTFSKWELAGPEEGAPLAEMCGLKGMHSDVIFLLGTFYLTDFTQYQ